jgi:putative DNA primase/helicase
LSIRQGEHAPLLTCHAGCDRRDVLASLRRRGLLETFRRQKAPPAPRPALRASPPPADKIEAILRSTRPIAGTLAESYLRGRGLEPELASPDALRFLPAKGNYLPAMVAVVTDIRDASRILGLQFTPLKPHGGRGGRTFLRGSKVSGGVVRLVDDAEVTLHLGVAEGVETALSAMTAMKRDGRMVLPTWSALNAGNLQRLPVLGGVERLYVFADNDNSGVGQRAAETLARRWAEAGREARVALPPVNDWNDNDWNDT